MKIFLVLFCSIIAIGCIISKRISKSCDCETNYKKYKLCALSKKQKSESILREPVQFIWGEGEGMKYLGDRIWHKRLILILNEMKSIRNLVNGNFTNHLTKAQFSTEKS